MKKKRGRVRSRPRFLFELRERSAVAAATRVRRAAHRAVVAIRLASRAVFASGASVAATLLPAARFAALATDLGHVLAILADGHTALATGGASLVRRKFVSSALLMGSTTTFAGDLALLLGIHRGEPAVASALAFGVIRHPADLQRY